MTTNDTTINECNERLQLFFKANDVSDGKKVRVPLSIIGSKNYALLRSLLAPTLSRDRSFDDIVKTLQQHFDTIYTEACV